MQLIALSLALFSRRGLAWLSCTLTVLISGSPAWGQPGPAPDESLLGEFVVTGTKQEHVPKIAVLPSLAPDLEDVIVRGVVRRDLELTGLFDVISDSKAPPGMYGFDDPVDVDAWKALGAEAIVKVAARQHPSGKIQVFGLAYFLSVGKDPVYEKKLLVEKDQIRITAHRITDALLGALTGRPGGFASHFTFSANWGRARRIFTMDSDGHNLVPVTDPSLTALSPAWGKNASLYYAVSKNYAPFRLTVFDGKQHKPVAVPFKGSIYSVALNRDHTKLAVAVGENGASSIYVGNPDGSGMKKVSTTALATHPAFSPSGKLGWLGGNPDQGSRRVYVDGKVVSPPGFTAAAPDFCDTEDGVFLVYAVAVGGDSQDLVMSRENGRGIVRLTQNQGSNSYPACSPDGRMLAFFSTRKPGKGLYMMSLKRFRTMQFATQYGQSLRWDALPPPRTDQTP